MGVVSFHELTALTEEILGDGTVGREGGLRAGGLPLPHSSWDLFWGQRGKPRLGPFKQEKLELALNSERVCWGLASCGLPQASRQAAGSASLVPRQRGRLPPPHWARGFSSAKGGHG